MTHYEKNENYWENNKHKPPFLFFYSIYMRLLFQVAVHVSKGLGPISVLSVLFGIIPSLSGNTRFTRWRGAHGAWHRCHGSHRAFSCNSSLELDPFYFLPPTLHLSLNERIRIYSFLPPQIMLKLCCLLGALLQK